MEDYKEYDSLWFSCSASLIIFFLLRIDYYLSVLRRPGIHLVIEVLLVSYIPIAGIFTGEVRCRLGLKMKVYFAAAMS